MPMGGNNCPHKPKVTPRGGNQVSEVVFKQNDDSRPCPNMKQLTLAEFGDQPNKCGQCKACCVILPVVEPSIAKPCGTPCRHLCSTGCGIWKQPGFPDVCRTYLCGYRKHGWLNERLKLRPDKMGVIVGFKSEQAIDGKTHPFLEFWECEPNAFRRSAKQIAYIRDHFPSHFFKFYPFDAVKGFEPSQEEVKNGSASGGPGRRFVQTGFREMTLTKRPDKQDEC